jgi:hypothetical protein
MTELILAMLLSLPVPMRDREPDTAALRRAHLETFAAEINKVARGAPLPPKEWAALLATIGNHETHFETRLVRGECIWEKRECDATLVKGVRVFRARGVFQQQPNTINIAQWTVANDNIPVQVQMANDSLRRAFNTCRGSGAPALQGTLRAYAGSSCTKPTKGEPVRLATFGRLIRITRPAARVSLEAQKPAG